MWYEAKQTRLDLSALARLCDALQCGPETLLVLEDSEPGHKRKSKR
jgi:DNA-binding Xre family transcriptional regulator